MKKAEFERRIKNDKKPLVVDLWAPWCAPCRAMTPSFTQVSKEFEGRVEVLKLNADESQEVLRSLGVMSIPTVIGFSGGREIVRRTGMQSADALKVIFEAALEGRRPAVMPPAPAARLVRSLLGIGALVAGWYWGRSIPLFVLGGVLIFSAFYDRCPIFRALAPRVKVLFKKPQKDGSST